MRKEENSKPQGPGVQGEKVFGGGGSDPLSGSAKLNTARTEAWSLDLTRQRL